MDTIKELNIKVAAKQVSRAIEEVIFCSIHPQMTGEHRREAAHNTFAESIVKLIEVIGR